MVGTSTSSIGATEEAYRRLLPDGSYPEDLRRPIVHTPHSLGDFVRAALGLEGVVVTVATACSSSAKVFAQAERLIRLGLADAAIVGGVDTLCGSVLFGFNSLELVSPEPCRPFDAHVAASASARRAASRCSSATARVARGCSATASRATRTTCRRRIRRVSARGSRSRVRWRGAALTPDAVDYINLHGTASQKNDEVEARLVAAMFPARTLASSTKGWTGHTLGAAGIVEAVITLLALENGPASRARSTRGSSIRPADRRFASATNRAEVAVRAEQLVRLRRQQLLAAVRRRDTGEGAMSTHTAFVERRRLLGAASARLGGCGPGAARRGGCPGAAGTAAGADAARPDRAAPRAGHRRRSRSKSLPAPARAPARIRSELPSVFASTHGDLAISDYMSETLASTPTLVSPIRFHNSVHNAAAGYWTIGTGCDEPYTALTAYEDTFGEGLLEALTQAACGDRAVLLVAYDIEARGPLATMVSSRGILGAGLVVSPHAQEGSLARVRWRTRRGGEITVALDCNAELVAGNAMATCLPFFEALARSERRTLCVGLSPALSLEMDIDFPGAEHVDEG